MLIALPSLHLLEIAGADAIAFTQAQFCNDVAALENGHWQWNAWLSPQGRVRAFFHLLRDDDKHLRLLLRGGDAEILRTELARYVFRTKVQLRALPDVLVFGTGDASALPAHFSAPPMATALASSDRITGLALPGTTARWLLLWPSDAAPSAAITSDDERNRWRLDDIRNGLPELTAPLLDQFLPQWLALDRLSVVSVRKGCYPGQEIMARLHFKGSSKRGCYRLEFHADVLPAPGPALQVSGTATTDNAGTIVMSAWNGAGTGEALAVIADAAHAAALSNPGLRDIKVISRFGQSALDP
jgi:hypothetical protein